MALVTKVFVSSTIQGLEPYREAVEDALRGIGDCLPVLSENFGAQDHKPLDACLAEVRSSDVFVGIVGHRYGSCPNGDVSISELEYNAAADAKKPRLMFVATEAVPVGPVQSAEHRGKQVAFRNRVDTERFRASFSNPQELAQRVVQAFATHITHQLRDYHVAGRVADASHAIAHRRAGSAPIIEAVGQATGAALLGVRTRLPLLDIEVPRAEVADIVNHLNQGQDVLLVGDRGSGKSAILGMVARSSAESGMPVLVINGRDRGDVGSPAELADRLGLPIGVIPTLRELAAGGPILLIVDQLDSALAMRAGATMADLVEQAAEIPNVRVLIASRTWDGQTRERLRRLHDRGFLPVETSLLPEDVAQGLLECLQITPNDGVVQLGRNLLFLSMLAELAESHADLRPVESPSTLWEAFREDLEQEGDGTLLAEALALAGQSVRNPLRQFALARPLTATQRALLSRETIVSQGGVLARFRHDSMPIHLLAWDAVEREWVFNDLVREYGQDGADLLAGALTDLYKQRKPEMLARLVEELR